MAWLKALILGAGVVGLYFWRRFVGGKYCSSKRTLKGKTVVITGANSGIGKATACELAKRDARVILACRHVGSGQAAVADIRRQTSSGQLIVKPLDLASFLSVRQFAAEIIREEGSVDILVNNAGVSQCPRQRTADGLEYQMGVNHLGHFLLTNLLLDIIRHSAPSRIVVLSSILMKNGKLDFTDIHKEKDSSYDKKRAYADSKLANAVFCRELAARLGDCGVGVFCVSPGMVLTALGRYVVSPVAYYLLWPLGRLLVKSPLQGCQTVLHCCLSEDLDGKTGLFYRNCTESAWPGAVITEEANCALWEISDTITQTHRD